MSRGVPMKTPERVAAAQAMRAGGAKYREIAAAFNVGIATVASWISDPEGTRLRARKDTYRRPCVDCGVPVSGSDRGNGRCGNCAAAAVQVWTRETIIDAVREWTWRYGEPPVANDWRAAARGNQEQVARWRAMAGRYPPASTVQREFGRWNDAIRAAGFEPRGVGKRRYP